ncbi:hypothetical protein ACTWPB_13800 [Nocardia sp. IBHARD005]|uniref:hypothetical protein n=1 Tax=Nocardia sp. IBHARD005 TaxID=3457765 RepID=UPI004057E7A0
MSALVRRATPDDVPAMVGLVHDLAEYEKAPADTPSIEFYRSLGAAPQDEWVGYRLAGAELPALAATAG